MPLSAPRRSIALSTKGFMPEDEGDALADAAAEAIGRVPGLPLLEVGTYCGRSTVWLGDVAEQNDTVVYTVDHHHGSEENQAGWEYHDPDVVDARTGRMDTLPFVRRTIEDARLEESVIAVVGPSATVARWWRTPLAFLFIDGGHGELPAQLDYELWTPHVAPGGLLAIHDVFSDPAEGGQAPHDLIYRPALDSGRFVEHAATGSLRVLRRVGNAQPDDGSSCVARRRS